MHGTQNFLNLKVGIVNNLKKINKYSYIIINQQSQIQTNGLRLLFSGTFSY